MQYAERVDYKSHLIVGLERKLAFCLLETASSCFKPAWVFFFKLLQVSLKPVSSLLQVSFEAASNRFETTSNQLGLLEAEPAWAC